MSIRFFRRVTILPGVTVNLARSGPSLSVGVRGAHVTFGRRGVRRTIGIPGTGVFYTSRIGRHTGFKHERSGARHDWWMWLAIAIVIYALIRA